MVAASSVEQGKSAKLIFCGSKLFSLHPLKVPAMFTNVFELKFIIQGDFSTNKFVYHWLANH